MRNLFILGCPRSGSSMVAEMHAGSGLLPQREDTVCTIANPRGSFESLTVRECNEALLAGLTPPEQQLLDGQHWLARLDPAVEYTIRPEVQVAIRERLVRPGCLKDSRFVWTLPHWLEMTPGSPIVCVFRSPVATAHSLLAACQLVPEVDRPALELADAYEIWIAHYTRVLDHLRHRGNWHFLHLDQVFDPSGLDSLEAFTGHRLNREVPDPFLRKSASDEGAPTRARELYAELCRLANYDPGATPLPEHAPKDKPEVALVVPILEHHRPHLPQLFEELANQRDSAVDVLLVDQTTDGGIEWDQATVLREPNPSRGLAYRRALGATAAPFIAWQDPAASSFPQRLAKQVAALKEHPTAQLCTSDLALRDANGQLIERLAIGSWGQDPPAHWQSTVVVRRSALDGLPETTFRPCELELFEQLRQDHRTLHLAEVLATVAEHEYQRQQRQHQCDLRRRQLDRVSPAPHPEITVLMACHNRKEALTECLEALARQDVPAGTFEVIVIDDGSQDGTGDLVRSLELPFALRYIHQANAGAASARNRGLPHIQSELVLFINDDTILFPHTLRGHLEAHRELRGHQAMVLGTFEQPPEECEKALTGMLEDTPHVFGFTTFEAGANVHGVHFYTCNLSLPTRAVREVGEFDELFPLFGEDTDYGLRLEDLGWTLYHRPSCGPFTGTFCPSKPFSDAKSP